TDWQRAGNFARFRSCNLIRKSDTTPTDGKLTRRGSDFTSEVWPNGRLRRRELVPRKVPSDYCKRSSHAHQAGRTESSASGEAFAFLSGCGNACSGGHAGPGRRVVLHFNFASAAKSTSHPESPRGPHPATAPSDG